MYLRLLFAGGRLLTRAVRYYEKHCKQWETNDQISLIEVVQGLESPKAAAAGCNEADDSPEAEATALAFEPPPRASSSPPQEQAPPHPMSTMWKSP